MNICYDYDLIFCMSFTLYNIYKNLFYVPNQLTASLKFKTDPNTISAFN